MYETEQCLIKGIMAGGRLSQSLSPEDFEMYGDIFKKILGLINSNRVPDFATVSAEYSDINKLIDCVRSDGTAAMVDEYAITIRRASQRKQALAMLQRAERELSDPDSEVEPLLDTLKEKLSKLDTIQSGWTDISDVMVETFEYLEARSNGTIKSITSGCEELDSIIGGFFGGELTIIGARPAVGKSAFAMNIAYFAALHGFHVGILSREMTATQFGTRLVTKATTKTTGNDLRKGEIKDWDEVSNATTLIGQMKLSFLFGVKNVEDLRRQVQRRVEKGKLDMLIVDYLQLMDTSSSYQSDHLRVGKISKTLKDIAVDFNIPVIALAQVNRDTDGQMPTLKSLKDSGSIEQDADGVIFLHRVDNPEDKTLPPEDKDRWRVITNANRFDYIVLGVAKQRQGSCGIARVLFDKEHMSYVPIQR